MGHLSLSKGFEKQEKDENNFRYRAFDNVTLIQVLFYLKRKTKTI